MEKQKLLVVSDSPVMGGKDLHTGFAEVVRALLGTWAAEFPGRIDFWGVNYDGMPHPLQERHSIYPASLHGQEWHSPTSLQRLCNAIIEGKYTHVWICGDATIYFRYGLPDAIRKFRTKGVHFTYYFPVDAPWNPEWSAIVEAVDAPVAYTDYGKAEALKANARWPKRDGTLTPDRIRVLPHGVGEEYHPLPAAGFRSLRQKWFAPFFTDFDSEHDRVLLNVNQHNKRKSLISTLALAEGLTRVHPLPQGRWRVLIHASNQMPPDGTDLEEAAAQLGLTPGLEWAHTDRPLGPSGQRFWSGGNNPLLEAWELNELYNAADAVVSTTLGEGWGLSITNALAAGVLVFVPQNTSCMEIAEEVDRRGLAGVMQDSRIICLPLAEEPVLLPMDCCRVRQGIDLCHSVAEIGDRMRPIFARHFGLLPPSVAEWLSWPRIAREFLKIFAERQLPKPALPDVANVVASRLGAKREVIAAS